MPVPPIPEDELIPDVRRVVADAVNAAEGRAAPIDVAAAPGPARPGDNVGGIIKQDPAHAHAQVDGRFDAGDDTGNPGIDATLAQFAAVNRGNVGALTALEIAAARIKVTPETFINPDGSVKKGALAELLSEEFAAAGPVTIPDARATTTTSYPDLGSVGDGDLTAMAFIVLMEAAKSARDDLAAIMDGVKAINREQAAWRRLAAEVRATLVVGADAAALERAAGRVAVTAQLDHLSELSEQESLRLQLAMDRQAKFLAALANALKHSSDTAADLIANLK